MYRFLFRTLFGAWKGSRTEGGRSREVSLYVSSKFFTTDIKHIEIDCGEGRSA